jgi:glyceraldehyde 3-phosphate dehydrogenase
MTIKVAINGFGRIGRCAARIITKRDDVQIVAINDTSDRKMTKNLLKYDSVHGRFDETVEIAEDDFMYIGNQKVKFFSDRNPNNLEFAKYGADVVLECTGAILTKEQAISHINNGIKKVVFSAPAKDDTPTFVMGVNSNQYAGEAIISNASCTTNALAPIVKLLNDTYGIQKALMTTIHSYTNDQNLLDVKHKKDLRRARAAALNLIPTTTGAAKAIGLVIPELQGKLQGLAVRVPTPNVSMIDLSAMIERSIGISELKQLFVSASRYEYKGFLGIDNDKLVSSDFNGESVNSIVPLDLLQVVDGNLIKVMSWYDNEWGYSQRLVDMAIHVCTKG